MGLEQLGGAEQVEGDDARAVGDGQAALAGERPPPGELPVGVGQAPVALQALAGVSDGAGFGSDLHEGELLVDARPDGALVAAGPGLHRDRFSHRVVLGPAGPPGREGAAPVEAPAPAPPPPFQAGDRDLDLGGSGDQNADVEHPVLEAADQLLALRDEDRPVGWIRNQEGRNLRAGKLLDGQARLPSRSDLRQIVARQVDREESNAEAGDGPSDCGPLQDPDRGAWFFPAAPPVPRPAGAALNVCVGHAVLLPGRALFRRPFPSPVLFE